MTSDSRTVCLGISFHLIRWFSFTTRLLLLRFSFLLFAFPPLGHTLLWPPFDPRILFYGCIVLLLLLKRKKIYQAEEPGMLMSHLN